MPADLNIDEKLCREVGIELIVTERLHVQQWLQIQDKTSTAFRPSFWMCNLLNRLFADHAYCKSLAIRQIRILRIAGTATANRKSESKCKTRT